MTTPELPGHVVMFLDAAEEHARYALDRAQDALGGAEAEAARDYHAESGRLQADRSLQAGQWAQGGVALSGISGTSHFADTADAVWYDAADLASGSAATLASIYGCLVYDDTLTTPVADQGMCFSYFGGIQQVTAGQFTVVWSALGVLRITV